MSEDMWFLFEGSSLLVRADLKKHLGVDSNYVPRYIAETNG